VHRFQWSLLESMGYQIWEVSHPQKLIAANTK